MATYDWGVDRTFKAAVDLSASQYSIMKAGSIAGECTLNATLAGSCIGVLQNDPKATEEATVRVLGFSKVLAKSEGGASPLTWGGYVKSGSDGVACGYINTTAGTSSSAWACGIWYDTAYSTTTGCIFGEMFVMPPFRIVASA